MKYIGNIQKSSQFMNNPISAGLKQTKTFCSIPVFLYGQWKRQASPRTNSDGKNLGCHEGTLLFLHWLKMEPRAILLRFKLIQFNRTRSWSHCLNCWKSLSQNKKQNNTNKQQTHTYTHKNHQNQPTYQSKHQHYFDHLIDFLFCIRNQYYLLQ